MYNLKCPVCGKELELNVGYTGADWNTEAGEGSGYGWEMSLDCTNNDCARIFPLAHLKELNNFSPVLDKFKRYKYR